MPDGLQVLIPIGVLMAICIICIIALGKKYGDKDEDNQIDKDEKDCQG